MSIYLGDLDYSKGYKGSGELAGVYWGDKLVIGSAPPLVSHLQFAGDGVDDRRLVNGLRAAQIWHIRYNAGEDPVGYNTFPTIAYNSNGEYPTIDLNYRAADQTGISTDDNFVSSISHRSYTVGTATPANSTSYTEINSISFRYDGVYDLSGGAVTAKGFNAPDTGIQHLIYTGNGVLSTTVEHGCNATPTLYILKGLESNRLCYIGGPLLGSTDSYVTFDTTSAVSTATSLFSAMDSTTITFGTTSDSNVNNSGSLYSLQLFYDVAGASASGTINAAGGSVHTETLGFEPGFILAVDPAASGFRYIILQDGQTTGAARVFNMNGNDTDGRNANFTTTADGFTIADGEKGNDGSSTLHYVALAK